MADAATEQVPTVTKIGPQPGPQEAALASRADIVIYGGSAGSGKTVALVMEPLRHHQNPNFRGVIFRRSTPQLKGSGSIWEEAGKIYPLFGGRMKENPTMVAEFPDHSDPGRWGASIEFLHLQYAQTVLDHQGKQYAFIGFDELTHFLESQFFYMLSRLRSTSGVVPYIRATCNPDPDSFVRKLIAWWIGRPTCDDCQEGTCREIDHGYPNPDRSGVLRWMVRYKDDLYWFDSEEEAIEWMGEMDLEPGKDADALSVTFIAAKLEDNPALLKADPKYRARLLTMGETERMQLLDGNWNVRHTKGGTYIRNVDLSAYWIPRVWPNGRGNPFEPEDMQLRHLPPLNIYTSSDYAVTPKEPGNDPDFTDHAVLGVDWERCIWVLDWWYGQTGSDVWIEELKRLWIKWKPRGAVGEKGTIAKAMEPSLQLARKNCPVRPKLIWVSTQTGEPNPTKEGYADRSKRAKAIRGRGMQENARKHRIFWHPFALEKVRQRIVQFPTGDDDAFDALANFCLALRQAHKSVVVPTRPKVPRDKYKTKLFGPDVRGPQTWKGR